ncbi:MAG: hypothetical protein WCK67_04340 [bacterium]
MKKNLLISIIFVLIMLIAKPWHWNFHIRFGHKTIAQVLELNKNQIEYEKMLKAENTEEITPLLEKLDKNTKLYKILINNHSDEKVIQKQKEVIDNLYKKYTDIQNLHMQKFENILTKEQKIKFKMIRTQLFLKN